jgi:exoribonuclease II
MCEHGQQPEDEFVGRLRNKWLRSNRTHQQALGQYVKDEEDLMNCWWPSIIYGGQ